MNKATKVGFIGFIGLGFIGGLITLSLDSCRHGLHAQAYTDYVQDPAHHLKRTVKTSDMEFTMQYKPYEYIICMENRNNDKRYDAVKRMSSLRGTAWFNISFKRANGETSALRYGLSSLAEYNQRLNYYLNYAQRDLRLLYDGDTLKPISFEFENNYNLAPQETMVAGFALPGKSDHPAENMQLVYFDRVFNSGIIKATFSTDDINNIPNLIY